MSSLVRIHAWLKARLARELNLALGVAVLLAAVLFLLASGWIGGRAVRAEHEASARRVAQLFEASLQNAMLNRDLAGMQAILAELGRIPGVGLAQVLSPSGEVRFGPGAGTSAGQRVGLLEGLCVTAGCLASPPRFAWQSGADGEVMRIAYPIRNQPRCAGCHGPAQARPVNGVLVVEFTEPVARGEARKYAWPMLVIGGVVITVLALTVWLVLRAAVLAPVGRLGQVALALGAGKLDARTGMDAGNEFGQLGRQLDTMAEHNEQLIAKLENHRGYLQRLIDASPEALVVIDSRYLVVDANAAYRRLVGVDDPIGQPCHRVSRGLDEPCPSTLVRCPLKELQDCSAPMRCVMQFRRVDGRPVDVEIDAAPMTTRDGERQVIEIIHPLEETLRFSQEQRLSSIGLLANGIAHEIHNPLASIRIALNAGQRGLRNGRIDHAELSRYLELVDREIDRCVAITHRLMRMSLPPGDTLAPVPMAAAVEETISLLREEASRGGVEVNVDIAPADLTVRADDAELRMLVLNLAQNALHAMLHGGRLAIAARVRHDRCVLTVQDSGTGIAADDLPLIFLPFYSRRADGRRGTGLGLAICRGSVERWGGSIRAQSELGKGSLFTVMIPLWRAAQ